VLKPGGNPPGPLGAAGIGIKARSNHAALKALFLQADGPVERDDQKITTSGAIMLIYKHFQKFSRSVYGVVTLDTAFS
jgi:hypothetical protein